MRNLAPKNLRQDRALVIFKCLIFRKIYPQKKGSETSNERKNTVFSPTSLHMPKKKTTNSLWPFLWWWKRWSLQRLELWKLPTFWDKVWVTSPELSELGEGLLNGGSGFLWDESGGCIYHKDPEFMWVNVQFPWVLWVGETVLLSGVLRIANFTDIFEDSNCLNKKIVGNVWWVG